VSSAVSHDGLRLAYERSGSGTPALFVHANGFCKELWRPVIDRLRGVDAVASDLRGHGSSEAGPHPFDWWDLGRDALALVDALGLAAGRIGVGHSVGGAALAMSEILRPGTWRALVLVEPIVPPAPHGRAGADHPLVAGALRRRASFADADEAFASYRGRGPFARWTDEALRLYVDHAFRDGDDGMRHLACSPETEAEFYRAAGAHGAWDRLGEVGCPAVVVSGADSASHPPDVMTALAGRFPRSRVDVVEEATHFAPMERPDAVAQIIQGVVDGPGSP
jgi:pimeloyl-ACP methyl ester carboxylesterase